jgi:hypothetical protein
MSDTSPAVRYAAINVSSADYTPNPPCRGIIIGPAGTGHINGQAVDMSADAATGELGPGWHPIKFKIIRTSGTTASAITVVW